MEKGAKGKAKAEARDFEAFSSEVFDTAKYLKAKQDAFDKVSDLSREIIRLSAQAITHLHNGMEKESKQLLGDIAGLVSSKDFSDPRFAYYAVQAQQEFAEAYTFYSIKVNRTIPSAEEIGVEREAYLLGLMDCVGELKREVLEELRGKNIEQAEYYFMMMRLIYDTTRPIRFAEAVLQGFRKKQDVARIQIENAGTEILSFRNRYRG